MVVGSREREGDSTENYLHCFARFVSFKKQTN